LLLLLCGCTPKEPVLGHYEPVESRTLVHPKDTFSSVVANSYYIAYGEVVGKSEAMEFEKRGAEGYNCYSLVTIEVIDCAKGGWLPGEQITYWEEGGTVEDRVYRYPFVERAEVGERVFLFRSHALPTRPHLCWVVDDSETIALRNQYLPDAIPAEGELTTDVSVRTILDAVRTELAQNPDASDTPERQIRRGGIADYISLEFADLMEKSAYVVRGKVTSKGEQELIFHDIDRSDCMRKVYIEVVDCARGDAAPGDMVFYYEYGGETTEILYTYHDWRNKITEIGDEVLLFVNDEGHVLQPWTMWILEPGQSSVLLENEMFPPSARPNDEGYATQIEIDVLLDAVRDWK